MATPAPGRPSGGLGTGGGAHPGSLGTALRRGADPARRSHGHAPAPQALGGGRRVRARRGDAPRHRRPGRPARPRPRLRLLPGRPVDHRAPDDGDAHRGPPRSGPGRGHRRPATGPGPGQRPPGARDHRLGCRPGRRPSPGAGPQRRLPRVRPQARHARRRDRRHAAPARRRPPWTAGDGLHARSTSSSGPGWATACCATTGRRTRASSSPWPPRSSSTCPASCRPRKPALYAVLRDFYRQDPATRLS